MPPESLSTRVSRRSSSRARLERALDGLPALAARDAVEVGEDEQVLLDGQRHVEVVELRRDSELCARLLRVGGQLEAEHVHVALVGDRLRREEAHRRRLPGAVRAEQADARAGRDVDVEAGHGGDLAVALDHAAELDRELAHRPPNLARAACRVGAVPNRALPLLSGDDLRATLAFYERLGFRSRGAPPEEWDYLIIECDGGELHFAGQLLGERTAGSCFIYADDIDAVYEQWREAAGDDAQFTPLQHTNYGMRAFTMTDPDGNEVRVGWPPR